MNFTATWLDSGTPTFRADGEPATAVTLSDGVATFATPLDAGEPTATGSYADDACFKPAPLATLTTRLGRTGSPEYAEVMAEVLLMLSISHCLPPCRALPPEITRRR